MGEHTRLSDYGPENEPQKGTLFKNTRYEDYEAPIAKYVGFEEATVVRGPTGNRKEDAAYGSSTGPTPPTHTVVKVKLRGVNNKGAFRKGEIDTIEGLFDADYWVEIDDWDPEMQAEWRGTASQLQSHGVPERRAKIVALIEAGYTYSEVADKLGVESKGSVGNQVKEFRQSVADAMWLVDNTPDI